MQVTPITPPDKPRLHVRRAFMAIRNLGGECVEHEVIDRKTNERVVLPAAEAWALHKKLNMEV